MVGYVSVARPGSPALDQKIILDRAAQLIKVDFGSRIKKLRAATAVCHFSVVLLGFLLTLRDSDSTNDFQFVEFGDSSLFISSHVHHEVLSNYLDS